MLDDLSQSRIGFRLRRKTIEDILRVSELPGPRFSLITAGRWRTTSLEEIFRAIVQPYVADGQALWPGFVSIAGPHKPMDQSAPASLRDGVDVATPNQFGR